MTTRREFLGFAAESLPGLHSWAVGFSPRARPRGKCGAGESKSAESASGWWTCTRTAPCPRPWLSWA